MGSLDQLAAKVSEVKDQRKEEAAKNRERFPDAAFIVDELRRVFGPKFGRVIDANNNNGDRMVNDRRLAALLEEGVRCMPKI